jgi:hypothetical protein
MLPAIETLDEPNVDPNKRELAELKKDVDDALVKEFMSNDWNVIVPDYEKMNREYKAQYGINLNIQVKLVIDKKNVKAHIEITNNVDPFKNVKSGKVNIVKKKDNELHLLHPEGHTVAKIIKKDKKFVYIAVNDKGEKMAEYEMKVSQ